MSVFRFTSPAGATALTLLTVATVISCGGTVTPPVSPVPGHPAANSFTRIASIPGRPFGIRVSSSGRLAITQQDLNSLTLVDVSGTGPRTVAMVGADPGEVVFSRTGAVAFVSGFNDGTVTLTNAASGSVSGSVTIGRNAYRLALSPDETRLYVSSTDGVVFVVNPAAPSVIASAIVGGALQGLALGASGQDFYLTSAAGRVSRLTASTLETNATASVGGLPQDVAVTADGTEVVVANERGWVDVLDGVTFTSRQRIPTTSGQPFGLAISPDDLQIYVTASNAGRVIVIDRATRTIVATINVGGTPRRVTFTPDGLTALVANEGGWVDVIR